MKLVKFFSDTRFDINQLRTYWKRDLYKTFLITVTFFEVRWYVLMSFVVKSSRPIQYIK